MQGVLLSGLHVDLKDVESSTVSISASESPDAAGREERYLIAKGYTRATVIV